eukprot:2082348-Lingulodinium_polyedra.AAC.1
MAPNGGSSASVLDSTRRTMFFGSLRVVHREERSADVGASGRPTLPPAASDATLTQACTAGAPLLTVPEESTGVKPAAPSTRNASLP